MQHWVIAGGSGLIGKALEKYCLSNNICYTIISRNKSVVNNWVSWQDLTVNHFKSATACINLVGKPIDCFWNKNNKQEIYNSRINYTLKLINILSELDAKPLLVSASGINIYDTTTIATESTELPIKPNWLSQLAMSWEAAANTANKYDIPVCNLRLAPVLSIHGGMLAKLLPLAKLGVLAKFGNGSQPFSWIGIDDVVAIIAMLINKNITGPVNLVAPEQLSQQEFNNILSQYYNKKSWITIPEFLVSSLLQEMGETLLLSGQAAKSELLVDCGYSFQHETLNKYLLSYC